MLISVGASVLAVGAMVLAFIAAGEARYHAEQAEEERRRMRDARHPNVTVEDP